MKRRISVPLLLFAILPTALAREEYTRTFDQTVPLHPGAKIYLEHKLGDIVIRTHSQPEVAIHAEIKVSAGDTNQAKDLANRIEILIEPSSSELSVRTRYPETNHSFFWPKNISYTVRYEVTIPESSPLEVRNSFGAVSVTGVKASSDVVTSHGDLEWRDGRGTQHLETSFANVRVANNAGDVWVQGSNGAIEATDVAGSLNVRDRFAAVTVARVAKGVTIVNSNGAVQISDSAGPGDVKNAFGDVTVHGFKGDLTVNTTNARVEALNIEGAAELNTTFGQVRFEDVARKLSIRANNSNINGDHVGGALAVENSFGPVKVSDVQSSVTIHSGNGGIWLSKVRGDANLKTSFGEVDAHDIAGTLVVDDANGSVTASNTRGAQITTSFAAVVLDGVAGALRVINQNGSVDAASVLQSSCEPILIRTSFSTLRVRLPGNASYHVAAKTSFGQIHTDFPLNVSGSISNDSLNGVIGSGHCDMTLNDNNGAIEIVKGGA